MKNNKNFKSSKVQFFFFTCAPSIAVYIGVAVLVLNMFDIISFTYLPFLIIGALWSLIGGYVVAANMSLVAKIGEPSEPVLKVKAGLDKLEAVVDMELSTSQMLQFLINIFFTIIFTVPVAALGWLLFVLYCKGVFMKKTSRMAKDCDYADEIIANNGGGEKEIAACAYRMLDYAEVYKKLGEKKGANEMIARSEKLMRLWKNLRGEE